MLATGDYLQDVGRFREICSDEYGKENALLGNGNEDYCYLTQIVTKINSCELTCLETNICLE